MIFGFGWLMWLVLVVVITDVPAIVAVAHWRAKVLGQGSALKKHGRALPLAGSRAAAWVLVFDQYRVSACNLWRVRCDVDGGSQMGDIAESV